MWSQIQVEGELKVILEGVHAQVRVQGKQILINFPDLQAAKKFWKLLPRKSSAPGGSSKPLSGILDLATQAGFTIELLVWGRPVARLGSGQGQPVMKKLFGLDSLKLLFPFKKKEPEPSQDESAGRDEEGSSGSQSAGQNNRR